MAEAFGVVGVNAEQASKRTMCRPTRQRFRGRLLRLGEMSEDYAQPLHRGSGGGTRGYRYRRGWLSFVPPDIRQRRRRGVNAPAQSQSPEDSFNGDTKFSRIGR